jgi:predicted MFS family arabinose efflux permease
MVGAGKLVMTQAPLRLAVIFSLLTFTLLRMGLYVHPAYLQSVGFDHAMVGFMLAGVSLLGAASAIGVEAVRRRIGEAGMVWGLPLVVGISYGLLSTTSIELGVALLGVQAVANGLYSPLSKELLNREIHESRQRATVLSVESMVRRLAFGAFAPAAGFLADREGLIGARMLCVAFALVGAVVLGAALRRRGAANIVGVPMHALDLPRSGPRASEHEAGVRAVS